MLNWFYPEARPKKETPQEIIVHRREKKNLEKADKDRWMAAMDKGGFVEGLIRIIVAISTADRILDREEFLKIEQITRTHERLKDIKISDFRRIAKEQSRIFQTDMDRAIETLAVLLPTQKDRDDVFKICETVFEDNPLSDETMEMMKRLAQGKSRMDQAEKTKSGQTLITEEAPPEPATAKPKKKTKSSPAKKASPKVNAGRKKGKQDPSVQS
jgi:tellurite resistance protein